MDPGTSELVRPSLEFFRDSFLTEGATPFAATDPRRIIPASMVGGAVTGGLSMTFGCTLRAPDSSELSAHARYVTVRDQSPGPWC